MLIFIIVVVIVVLTVLLGIGLAFGLARLDTAVKENQVAIENMERGYNPAVTLGHRLPLEADPAVQLKEARRLAAKQAAAMPRGANMGIGRLGHATLRTASQRLEKDPITAVKVALHHSWSGAKSGFVQAAPAAAAALVAAAPTGKIELVPGKDYPVIEISDDMAPDEKRKARIANAKAKSAAMKAAKEAGAAAPAAAAPAVAAQAAPAAPAAVAVTNLPEPPTLIELTDDMTPDEKRKARIANSKAKSAYNKALKAAGLDPKAVAAGQVTAPAAAAVPAAEPAPAPAAAAPEAAPAVDLSNIPAPDYVEMTDDMSPDEKRKARIHNAKARSAYNKALKAAGIDPKSVTQ